MKKFLSTVVLSVSLLLSACGDGLTNREVTCLEHTGNIHCKSEGQYAVDQTRAERGVIVGQSYTNHYGNPQHGSWNNGQYSFHNPNGVYAMQTDSFLLGAGVGGLAAYALTSASSRESFNRDNPNGFKARSKSYNKPRGKDGKILSKAEAKKRKAQSIRDKRAHKAKLKQQAKNKAKQTKQNSKKKLDLRKKPVQNKSKFAKKRNKSSYSKPKAQQRKSRPRPSRKSSSSRKRR